MTLDSHMRKDKNPVWEVYKYPYKDGVGIGMYRMDSEHPRPHNSVVIYSGCTYQEGCDFMDDVFGFIPPIQSGV